MTAKINTLEQSEMAKKIGKLEEELAESQNKYAELQGQNKELQKENAKLQYQWEDRSFLCAEMEIELNVLREKEQQQHLEPLVEMDEEQQNSNEKEQG